MVLILFSDKKQTLSIGKAPLKASPICAKSADAVSCRLPRADAPGKADFLCFSWESGMTVPGPARPKSPRASDPGHRAAPSVSVFWGKVAVLQNFRPLRLTPPARGGILFPSGKSSPKRVGGNFFPRGLTAGSKCDIFLISNRSLPPARAPGRAGKCPDATPG